MHYLQLCLWGRKNSYEFWKIDKSIWNVRKVTHTHTHTHTHTRTFSLNFFSRRFTSFWVSWHKNLGKKMFIKTKLPLWRRKNSQEFWIIDKLIWNVRKVWQNSQKDNLPRRHCARTDSSTVDRHRKG